MKKLFSILLIAFVAFVACEKDNKTTGPSGSDNIPEAPEFIIPSISIPAALMMNSNPHAQIVAQYGLIATVLTAQYSSMLVPANSADASYSDGKWTYMWDADADVEYKLVIEDKGSNGYEWNVYLSGNLEGVPVSGLKIMSATQAKDEKSNEMTFYDIIKGEIGSYDWHTDAEEVDYITLVAEEYEDGIKIEAVLNPDQSGQFTLYTLTTSEGELSQKFVWQADGTGEWWEYENGQQSDNGTW